MTLGGKRMEPLGWLQWAGILLTGGSLVLTGYVAVVSIALIDAPSQTAPLMPLKWLLLAGMVGLLGSGLWVQFTWKTQ